MSNLDNNASYYRLYKNENIRINRKIKALKLTLTFNISRNV